MPVYLFCYWLPTSFVMVVTSFVYFSSNRSTRLGTRLGVSVHGLLGTALFSGAVALWMTGGSRDSLAWPFTLLFVLPLASMLAALLFHRGTRIAHLLLAAELFCLALAWFVGGMAITDEWLPIV